MRTQIDHDSSLNSCFEMATDRQQYRIGIVGYGLAAKIFHIPYIRTIPELCLQAICQRKASPSSNAAEDHPSVEIFQDADQLIQNAKVDVIVLCTPPTTHFSLAKKCLEYKKHGMFISATAAYRVTCVLIVDSGRGEAVLSDSGRVF
jgi:N-acetyl-gamma-glutamylphosphate reductase